MNGREKKIIALLILFYGMAISFGGDENSVTSDKTIVRINKFYKDISPGIKKNDLYDYCKKSGWHSIPHSWGKGVVRDTVHFLKKKEIYRFNVEFNAFSNEVDTLALLVEFRKCGNEYILYQYCFEKLTEKTFNCSTKMIRQCFNNKENQYKSKYSLKCAESILKTKQDSLVDTMINNMLY